MAERLGVGLPYLLPIHLHLAHFPRYPARRSKAVPHVLGSQERGRPHREEPAVTTSQLPKA